jgi:hypothetical protein
MPARTGKCINFGGCSKADSREVMTVPDGNEFVCPECEKSLMATGGGKGKSAGPGSGSGKLKYILAAVLGLGAIGGVIAWLVTPSLPSIQFSVEPTLINAGQTANLKWSVENATDVQIAPIIGAVQTEDTFPISPQGTTTYTLTAKKGDHVVTKSVTLQVNGSLPPPPPPPPQVPMQVPGPGPAKPPAMRPVSVSPVISSFSANPSVVQLGQPVVLQWSTRNATRVSFPGTTNNNLPPIGSVTITPRAVGNYPVSLMAIGQGTPAQQSLTIRVVNPNPRYAGPPPMPRPPAAPAVNPQSNGDQEQEPEAPRRSAPAAGTLIWEGDIQGTTLVTIQNGMASPGQLISGSLPGVPIILQQETEKKVGIASAPSPDNNYQRLVLRVFGHGHTRVVVHWSTP